MQRSWLMSGALKPGMAVRFTREIREVARRKKSIIKAGNMIIKRAQRRQSRREGTERQRRRREHEELAPQFEWLRGGSWGGARMQKGGRARAKTEARCGGAMMWQLDTGKGSRRWASGMTRMLGGDGAATTQGGQQGRRRRAATGRDDTEAVTWQSALCRGQTRYSRVGRGVEQEAPRNFCHRETKQSEDVEMARWRKDEVVGLWWKLEKKWKPVGQTGNTETETHNKSNKTTLCIRDEERELRQDGKRQGSRGTVIDDGGEGPGRDFLSSCVFM
ncbi:hypothetical protein B0H14DRAFT_2566597 [Mycena olivaceomarginata]|nr:hypothetical protein B0H14DRAFT_2566597 [Mycena olivaceomarginata]